MGRVGFTMRLNRDQQRKMQKLISFWNKEPREIMAEAINQLHIATVELEKVMDKEQEKQECATKESSGESSEDSSPSSQSPSSPTSEPEAQPTSDPLMDAMRNAPVVSPEEAAASLDPSAAPDPSEPSS